MAADKSQRMDVFTCTDDTPAPGDYQQQTTKSSAPTMEISDPFERKPTDNYRKIRSQTKWHTRGKTLATIPSKRPVFFMPEDI